MNSVFIKSIYNIGERVSELNMKRNQKFESCTLEFPTATNFSDLDIVEQVVEEAFIREPKKRRKKV
jgi:hypothetical protein